MIALTEALNRLEVGKVAVARIRDRMDLVHSFDDTYTSEKAGFIVSQFRFEH
jgi:midasin (ATPase involved in ribosome maturation)